MCGLPALASQRFTAHCFDNANFMLNIMAEYVTEVCTGCLAVSHAISLVHFVRYFIRYCHCLDEQPTGRRQTCNGE